GVGPDGSPDEAGRQVALTDVDAVHVRSGLAGGEEHVDPVVDQDHGTVSYRVRDGHEQVVHIACVGVFFADLHSGDAAVNGAPHRFDDAAVAGQAAVGDEINAGFGDLHDNAARS